MGEGFRGPPRFGKGPLGDQVKPAVSTGYGEGGPPWVPGPGGGRWERLGRKVTARSPHHPHPRGRGLPVLPASPAGPNSPHPEPRGERGAETDGEVGVAAMQLRCVRGTGQSWRQLRDRPRPSNPVTEWPNRHAGPGRPPSSPVNEASFSGDQVSHLIF